MKEIRFIIGMVVFVLGLMFALNSSAEWQTILGAILLGCSYGWTWGEIHRK